MKPKRGWLMKQYEKMDQEVKGWPRWAQDRLEKESAVCKRIVEASLARKAGVRGHDITRDK